MRSDARGAEVKRSGEPSWSQLAAYGLPALPLALLALPFYVIVPSHYATLGVPIALVGQVLLAVRLFDAFSDPIAGHLSDRTRSRFGRRKLWFASGVPLTALAAYMLFTPPAGAGWLHLLGWGLLLSLGWTIALVPYSAWGAELSRSYEGRSRVTLVREGFTFVGTLAALLLQYAFSGGESAGTDRALAAFAITMAVALPLASVVALALAPEPENRSRKEVPLTAGIAAMMANRPFRRLVAAYLANGLANGLPMTLFLLFVADRLELAPKAGLFLLVYFVAGLAGMPFWLRVAARRGKHAAWCWSMLLSCVVFAFAPFLGPGAETAFLLICLGTGFAVGADLVLPASLQADVIDVDTAATGEERSGLYLAVWGLATKLALALAVGIAFPLLAAAGYDPAAGAKSAFGLWTLGMLYAALPVALKLMAVAIMWRFPLDAEGQRELRAAIETARKE